MSFIPPHHSCRLASRSPPAVRRELSNRQAAQASVWRSGMLEQIDKSEFAEGLAGIGSRICTIRIEIGGGWCWFVAS
ncbi:hypothetical protein ASPZODRAFT_15511 [Penicilliopsis zonata CBS 506.65]|uniref:Uncharacterized protein n=1 Tax=Penicilliopsis zonata CBS 506.65 TaxID=1073090 RepID=A0A1L9SI55_9EURO|nr:hypothetical protein ASPZODRAFT_15511 [Penicilliopsis zonata CBS 506.65]OJJ46817.1 hypothetical protein ASPZODRAFT_15511 [Penicilliopsis zonata CBS 506.65]